MLILVVIMSNENFSAFNNSPPSQKSSSYNITSTNRQQSNNNRRKLSNKIEKVSVGNYGSTELQRLIVEEVENKVNEIDKRLNEYKTKLDEDEFRLKIKKVLETLTNTAKSVDSQIISLKKFQDLFMQSKNNSKVYIPGLDNDKKLAKIDLPDIIGFVKDESIRKDKKDFIRNLTLMILGLSRDSNLYDQIAALNNKLEEENKTSDFEDALNKDNLNTNGSLGNLSNVNDLIKNQFKIIYNWRPYAQLLTQISKDGKIDFEVFMKTRKPGDDTNQSSSKHKSKQKKKHGQIGQQSMFHVRRHGGGPGKPFKKQKSPGKPGYSKGKAQQIFGQIQQRHDKVSHKTGMSQSDNNLLEHIARMEPEEWHYQAKNYFKTMIGKPGKDRSQKLLGQIVKNIAENEQHIFHMNGASSKLVSGRSQPPASAAAIAAAAATAAAATAAAATAQLPTDLYAWYTLFSKIQDLTECQNITEDYRSSGNLKYYQQQLAKLRDSYVYDALLFKEKNTKESDKSKNCHWINMITNGTERYYDNYSISYLTTVDEDPVELEKLRNNIVKGILTYLITIRKVYINLITRLETTYRSNLEPTRKKQNTENEEGEEEGENIGENVREEEEDVREEEENKEEKNLKRFKALLEKTKNAIKKTDDKEKKNKLYKLKDKLVQEYKKMKRN